MTPTSVRFLKALCVGMASFLTLAACGTSTGGGGGLSPGERFHAPDASARHREKAARRQFRPRKMARRLSPKTCRNR